MFCSVVATCVSDCRVCIECGAAVWHSIHTLQLEYSECIDVLIVNFNIFYVQ
jgi:tetrahydromethanopterin S-methyltransferase subunit A